MDEELTTLYFDPRQPAAFGGVDRLRKAASHKTSKIQEWLSGQRVYTLHRAVRKRYNTRRYKVAGPHQLWQADLVEMIPYANENDEYRYLLTVIDVFSRYAWARPLKSKTGVSVAAAFQEFFNKMV